MTVKTRSRIVQACVWLAGLLAVTMLAMLLVWLVSQLPPDTAGNA